MPLPKFLIKKCVLKSHHHVVESSPYVDVTGYPYLSFVEFSPDVNLTDGPYLRFVERLYTPAIKWTLIRRTILNPIPDGGKFTSPYT